MVAMLTRCTCSVRLADMQKKFLLLVSLALLVAGHVNAQTLFKCKDAAGNVQFSDRPCKGGVPIRPKVQPDSPERKAESDAHIQRDMGLAKQAEAARLAQEQANQAAQNQQQQINSGLSDKVEQGRVQQRSTVNSVDTSKPVPERTN